MNEVSVSINHSANFIIGTNDLEPMTLKQVGDYIKLVRVSKNLNQKDLADLAGVHQAQVSKLENGKEVGAQVLDKVTTALEIEIHLTFPRK